MAERRMFSKSVIGSARFLRMPASSRLLYYDLGMQADDDGMRSFRNSNARVKYSLISASWACPNSGLTVTSVSTNSTLFFPL